MKIKGITSECFSDYKKPALYVAFPYCTFKCDKECNECVCQNSALANEPNIEVDISKIIDEYLSNSITKALVCGGLEPFDSWGDLKCLIMNFRYKSNNDIVIYTGYKEEELSDEIKEYIKIYSGDGDIIIKYGRFIPNQKPHYDEILGVNLASDNQYAVRYNWNGED